MADMEEIIRQIRVASASGLYYLALFGALALPDICGALDSDDGRASRSKYKAWFRNHVPEYAGEADAIYGVRCSLLHQGRSLPHGGHEPIAFMYPAPDQGSMDHVMVEAFDGSRILYFSIPRFIDQLTQGAETWYAQFGSTRTVIRNMEKFARLRPDGIPPHVVGVAVIA